MEKQKADSGILQKFILNCNYVSTWSSMKFLINDNEEENTIKRDVYIQWRVGGIIYDRNYVRCASKLYQEKKGEIIQCIEYYVMLDG